VREQVLESETKQRVELPHYPESLSLELTPVCSLQCPHCSSHGRPHLHQHHNQLPEMSPAMLQRIGHEAFAHTSVISLVGRGEPTRATDTLWTCLSDLVRQHDVRISCVSNGTRLDGRLDAALMPWIHEVTFSVDGATTRTFELNRRGARLAAVMKNIRRFHELRCSSQLAHRPQLTISWTLKRNNVGELPAFVDMIIPCEPDLLSIRHMVIFQDEEKEQSLLGDCERANRLLRKAYEKLERHGIRYEGPPLMLEPAAVRVARPDTPFVSIPERTCAERERRCNWMHRTAIIMSDGEVTTCGKHYGAQVGHLNEQTSLWDIWNGPAMCSLRATFGRDDMWHQCQHCWLREIRWHSQRQAKDAERVYAFSEGMDFTQSAWDYRRYSEL
jgi:radical SAM protein with 4Fe4S-binding SPASM domain